MKILCVDDDPAALLVLSSLIDSFDYEAIEASSAELALEMLDDPEISLILCDWEMPGMNGPDLCRHIRANETGRYFYFILVTGRTEEDSLIEGLNAGADDFINKPVNREELRVRLRGAERVLELEQKLDTRNKKLAEANARIEKAFETVTADLELAAQMQFDLLPKQQLEGDIAANWVFKPASFIAGDMFDYFSLSEDLTVFYIVDVEGHGIPSALTSFAVNNLLNPSPQGICARWLRESDSVVTAVLKTVEELNLQFTQSEASSRYFTMIYGVLDKRNGEVVMTQAGHPPALHYRSSERKVYEVGKGGFPVGMFETAEYDTVQCKLGAGDRLFIYSDGTIECPKADGEMYGAERLNAKILQWADTPVENIDDVLDEEFVQWNGSTQFEDDVSMLCLEYRNLAKAS